ncbi:MAG: sigma-70 family RNA polymerase sigma factor [Ruminococcus sp.]|nr:sigma-70 family RNA polymerase sigma factor [Ruminococcus sp.]
MNTDLINKMVSPHLINNTFLSYTDFEKLFKYLSSEERKEARQLLSKEGIEFIYPDIIDSKNDDDNDDIELFRDSTPASLIELNKKDVKQTNETLCKLIHRGNEQAKNDLCIKNRMLVMKYAAKYAKYYGNKLDVEDLEQIGYIGLLKAADKFDPSLETRFSTYAVLWIKQAMLREIFDNGFTIRLPVHIMEKMSRVIKLDNKYELQGLSFNERIQAISSELQIGEDTILEYLTLNLRFRNCASLNAPVGEEKETELEEFIEDTDSISVEDSALQLIISEDLKKIINTLSEREAKVIMYRFGFIDGRERTLEEIGQMMGVTRERIRQIESKAFRKLRHPSRTKHIKDFL